MPAVAPKDEDSNDVVGDAVVDAVGKAFESASTDGILDDGETFWRVENQRQGPIDFIEKVGAKPRT